MAQNEKIIKEGVVTKQGGRIKTWKRRFCVLTPTSLKYYKMDKGDTHKFQPGQINYENVQGEIAVASIEAVAPVTEATKKKNCFKLVTPLRTFVISAETEKDMQSWIDAIKTLLQNRHAARGSVTGAGEVDYNSKTLDELERTLSGLEESMNHEINQHLETALKDKDEILDVLMERDVAELRRTNAADRADIISELQRRGP